MRLHAQAFELDNHDWATFKGTLTGFDYETSAYTVEFADDGEVWDHGQVRAVDSYLKHSCSTVTPSGAIACQAGCGQEGSCARPDQACHASIVVVAG
jgi:hypothetical protein